MKGEAAHGVQIGRDFQITEEERHFLVHHGAVFEQRTVRAGHQHHAVHAHGQMKGRGHMTVVQVGSCVRGIEFIRRRLPSLDVKGGGRDTIVRLVHIQSMKVNGVAFRTGIFKGQHHIRPLGVFQQGTWKRNVSVRGPSISPNGKGRSIVQKMEPVHF